MTGHSANGEVFVAVKTALCSINEPKLLKVGELCAYTT